ncbi:MAG: hypothetical protein H5T33_07175 [Candidatus Methanosuratus sp.]|nr:hypothetical protein [Candidatus Methanosuratincola sp.]
MRTPIFVRIERFNLDDIAADIEAVRECFDRYLDSYPVKSARSKHSLMGPIGKVLQEARTGKWDTDSLTGYALNIHLANPKAKGHISQESREALRNGIEQLLQLLGRVPITAQDKVVDRIDYGLYFVRRAKGLERLERIRQEFISSLRKKYQTPEALALAWGGKPEDYGADFSEVRYPSKTMFNEATGQKKIDIREFAREAQLKGYELIDEEEEIE